MEAIKRPTAKWRDKLERIRWSKRIGVMGFLFFLGKGLFWLAMLSVPWWFQ